MDLTRDLFIEQLVAALQENTALVGGISSLSSPLPHPSDGGAAGSSSDSSTEDDKSPQVYTGLFQSESFSTNSGDTDRLARDAYMQLQFDYPQLQQASIEALAELYRRVSADKSTHHVAGEIPITATLLDGVAFLNDQSPSYSSTTAQRSRSSEGSALLAASLLLLVFRLCLETPKDPRAENLLSSLIVKQTQQQTNRDENSSDESLQEKKESEFLEKYAAHEDPDDLSEVYEGHLSEPRVHRISMRNHHTTAVSSASMIDKLRYLASCTYSSSFASVSIEKWEQWRLDDELVAIMRFLVDRPPENNDKQREQGENKSNNAPVTLYGPRGEWSRYLYVLRDRALRFPGSSRNALWRLKELIEFLQRHELVAITVNHSPLGIQPQHLAYRVLAELAISREFHQSGAQRAQQGLTLVIQELLPSITQEIHQLSSVTSRQKASATSDSEDDELVLVFLQLLHFMLFASPNARMTTEKLLESGMLRTLLMLLPPANSEVLYKEKRWFPALLRLLGECALWHPGFAAYISRVPKMATLLPTLRGDFVAEELVFALAFRHHQVNISTRLDVWETFGSESLLPQQCASYLDAMKKLQDAVFVLDCLEKVLGALRPAVQTELQRSLQQIYSRFNRSFEYPTFAAAEKFEQKAMSTQDQEKDKKEEDRGQAEALQFTALRNKLRQSVKALLAALSSGFGGGRVASKLD